MDLILKMREKIQEIYADHTLLIMKAVQFAVALCIFMGINQNIGYMKLAKTPVIALGLAVICTFLPMVMTPLVAAGLFMVHMYAVSYGFLAATAIIFLLMFVFYFRLTPKMALFAMLTPLACVAHIPFAVTMTVALIYNPISAFCLGFGIIAYNMMEYVKQNAASLSAEDAPSIVDQVADFIQTVLTNQEMWLMILAMVISALVIYTLRKQSFTQAWKIAIISGTAVYVFVSIAGGSALKVSPSSQDLLAGSVVAVIIGLILEIFYFSVDYSRTEHLDFEDEDYYYYVKAVPKLKVGKSRKSVKKINGKSETELMDAEEVRRRTYSNASAKQNKPGPRKQNSSRVAYSNSSRNSNRDVDRQLLEESMKHL